MGSEIECDAFSFLVNLLFEVGGLMFYTLGDTYMMGKAWIG